MFNVETFRMIITYMLSLGQQLITYGLYLPFWAKVIWLMSCLVIGEAVYQLRPLYVYNVPYASRTSYLFAIIKYGGALIANLFLLNWAMSAWLFIGFLKEFLGWIKLRQLKKGYEI